MKYSLPYHYSLVPSEAASNLARYDGIRYGYQPDLRDRELLLEEYISESKTNSFGANVKRRIVLGNFLMSSGGGYEDFNKKLIDA